MFRGAIGGLMLGAGVLLMMYGVLMRGTAPNTDTLNLGLLVDKITITLVGCTIFTAGVMVTLSVAVSQKRE